MKKILFFILNITLITTSYAQQDSLVQDWTFGAKKGFAQISGEADSKSGFAFGFFVEKHFGNLFSAQVDWTMGSMQGLSTTATTEWTDNPIWNGTNNPAINYNNAASAAIYPNYKVNYMEANLLGKFTLSQLAFFKNYSPFDGFLLGGIGGISYETKVDAADLNGDIYDFSTLQLEDSKGENRAVQNLNALFDGVYETALYETAPISLFYHVGGGVQWQYKKKLTIALTHRVSFLGNDDLDAYQFEKGNDLQHFTSISIGYTIAKKKRIKEKPLPIEPPTILEEIPEPPVVIEAPKDTIPTIIPVVEALEEEVIVKRAFDHLEFQTGKAVIQEVSFNSLNELAELLNKQTRWKLRIAGHTDNVGNANNNLNLSKRRVEAVRDYLASKGVSTTRFLLSWYGETEPIADNDTVAGRQRNRRVEMEIVK